MKEYDFSQIQDILNEMVSKEAVSGVNCLIFKDENKFYYQSGYADIENQIVMKRDTIFRLYSMSKPMTAAAVMLLVQDGKLDIASPVSDYIPSFLNPVFCEGEHQKLANREVSIKDLLNMTAGCSYDGNENLTQKLTGELIEEIKAKMESENALNTQTIAERLGKIPLAFEPGTEFLYGMSADILGAIIENVSGKKFSEFLKERIWEPLGMENTGFYVPDSKQGRLAKVYKKEQDGLHLYEEPNLGVSNKMNIPPVFESGGAGLVSTVDDWSKFCEMLLNQGSYHDIRIFSPGIVRFLTESVVTEKQRSGLKNWDYLQGYSYGNLMRVLTNPEQAVTLGQKGEYGWDGWLGAYMTIDPVDNMYIIVMMQLVDAGTTTYTRRIRNVVFSKIL